MHFTDISHAIEHNEISACEDAFRALIGYPHEEEIIDGPKTADGLVLLLTNVCESLKTDGRTMPGGIQEAIQDTLSRRVDAEDIGPLYSQAAAIVAEHVNEWRAVFITGGAKD